MTTTATRTELRPLTPEDYVSHRLHGEDRCWTETNCYVDVWVEVLHAFGFDPLAAAAFVLGTDFEGDQWNFSKFPPEDLRAVYGIRVAEINVWRPGVDHVADYLSAGRLLTVEADAWYLPDTHGSSYRTEHVKTTIVPQMLDRERGVLGYFHNAGYWELSGADFEGVFRLGGATDPHVLPPYVEGVWLPEVRRSGDELAAAARDLARVHLARRPDTNPVTRLAERLAVDLPDLAGRGLEYFHLYAFGTLRQCGATAELASSFVAWLAARDSGRPDGPDPDSEVAVAGFRKVAELAKSVQFFLARAAVGRKVDVAEPLAAMEESWATAIEATARRYG